MQTPQPIIVYKHTYTNVFPQLKLNFISQLKNTCPCVPQGNYTHGKETVFSTSLFRRRGTAIT